MTYDYEAQKKLNAAHLEAPEPGDYWQDQLAPVCVVLQRFGTRVLLCRTSKDAGDGKWTWNLEKLEMTSLEDFKEWLSYKSSGLLGTWADVMPGMHAWAVDEVGLTVPGADTLSQVQEAVDCLNELQKLDDWALRQLIQRRVPCTDALAAHSKVRTKVFRDRPEIGLLGVLNALIGTEREQIAWDNVNSIFKVNFTEANHD